MFTFSGAEFAEAERAAERALNDAAVHLAGAEAAMQHQQRQRTAHALRDIQSGAAEPLGVPKPSEDWRGVVRVVPDRGTEDAATAAPEDRAASVTAEEQRAAPQETETEAGGSTR